MMGTEHLAHVLGARDLDCNVGRNPALGRPGYVTVLDKRPGSCYVLRTDQVHSKYWEK